MTIYFELLKFILRNSVGFGDDGNDVDLLVQLLHADQIK
jgi:hypothetical protein